MNRSARTMGSAAATALITVVLTGLLPAAALAHGIGDTAVGRSTLEFIPLGIEHMAFGWDHLLFIVGIVLLAGTARLAAKLITAFVVGHSTTLIIATLAGWQVSATAVDVVIALSLVFVGVVAYRGRPQSWTWVLWSVLGFGLIHGLGLSTRLQDLGLERDGLLGKVLAFNLGVEIGQLTIVAVVALIAGQVARRTDVLSRLRPSGAFALAAIGFIAAWVLFFGAVFGGDSAQLVADPDTGAGSGKEVASVCQQTGNVPPGGFGGTHPDKRFYEPTDVAPQENLDHVIGDGYVIVHYRPDLPQNDIAGLRAYVDGTDGSTIAAPAEGQRQAVVVNTAQRKLICDEADLDAINTFGTTWLADAQAGRVE